MTMHALQPVDLAFFERAPFRIAKSFDVACEAKRVTQSLRNNADWAAWAAPIKLAQWTSPEEGGEGSTRDVWLHGGIRLRELFFCWKEAERVAFYIAAANVPGLIRFAEDYRITAVRAGVVRITWTLCFQPAAHVLGHVIKGALLIVTPAWLRTFKKLLENQSAA